MRVSTLFLYFQKQYTSVYFTTHGGFYVYTEYYHFFGFYLTLDSTETLLGFRGVSTNDVTDRMLIIDQAPSVWEELSVVHDIPVQHQEDHEVTNVEWKGKGKAILLDSEEPVADPEMLLNPWIVDWTEYEPPDGLKFTGDIDPELVILIQESIDRIKTRILEEGERKSAAEAAKQKQKEKADQEEGNPEKSETSPHDDWVHPDELHQPLDPEEAQDRDQDAPRARKQGGFLGRTVMSLFRKLNGSAEHGESSSAGAARHRLLAQSSQVELTTHSARKRFVLDLLKKNTGENKSTGSTASIQEAEV